MTWTSDDIPQSHRLTAGSWGRIVLRGVPLAVLISVCFVALLLLRLIEWPVFGMRRPITPYLTQFVCRNALRLLRVSYSRQGEPMAGPGAMVANHSGWLDIFSLNAAMRLYFVAKSEVSGWAGIGWLARGTGTVFVVRDRKHAKAQVAMFEERLKAGHKLLFFPEGTSTDGTRVLPFKPTLFASFFTDDLRPTLAVQPVTIVYTAPKGEDRRFYGWWGEMEFGTHFLATLAAKRGGSVKVVYHTPIALRDVSDRKALAKQAELAVRSGLEEAGVTPFS